MDSGPAWVAMLNKSLTKNRRLAYARYLQLSTVRENGRPACRTVVFRGFAKGSTSSIKIITDTRSEKIEQLRRNPWVEACWYFPVGFVRR